MAPSVAVNKYITHIRTLTCQSRIAPCSHGIPPASKLDSNVLFLPCSSIMVRFPGNQSNDVECHFLVRLWFDSWWAWFLWWPQTSWCSNAVCTSEALEPESYMNSITDGGQRLLKSRDPTRRGQQEQAAHLIRCSNSTPTILLVFECMFQTV